MTNHKHAEWDKVLVVDQGACEANIEWECRMCGHRVSTFPYGTIREVRTEVRPNILVSLGLKEI